MPSVLITGASQGIGAAIAEAFASESDARIALASRNRPGLEAVADRCRTAGAEVQVLPCDVTIDAEVARLAEAFRSAWGAPDVLVNNAGLFAPGTFFETDADTFRRQVAVNLTSAFLVTQALLPSMVAAGRGDVFFLGSVASIRGYPGGVGYCAAKHGVLGLARVVREETKDRGIRVVTLLPGATWTPSWEGIGLPESRFIPAEDVARTVVEIHRLDRRTVVEEILLRPQLGDL